MINVFIIVRCGCGFTLGVVAQPLHIVETVHQALLLHTTETDCGMGRALTSSVSAAVD